ncbi:unnamed protein product [Orchesella dallaii]|uniref:SLC26A/SulP transporter domain-containing protein n=1 Tax=Orchesella dallaii TaxID=48710 RepID=A0ABP1RMA7_9HEXA
MKTELLHSNSCKSLLNMNLVREPSTSSLFTAEELRHMEASSRKSSDGSTTEIVQASSSTSGSSNSVASTWLQQWCKSTFRKKTLRKRLPILDWSRDYSWQKFAADCIAGLTVGLTILPQGLAYASLAGLPPQYGLYSGFIGSFIYVLFGATKAVTIGPTAILSIITLAYTAGKPKEYAVLLCFLSGVVTFLTGVFQLGFIVNFISQPVLSGFTTVAAITICSTQVKSLLGLHFPADGVVSVVQGVYNHVDEISENDAILSIICILTLLTLRRLQDIFSCCVKKDSWIDKLLWFISTSRSCIVIGACTVFFSLTHDESLRVSVMGEITPGLPSFQIPPFLQVVNMTLESDNDVFADSMDNTTVLHHQHHLWEYLKTDSSPLLVIPLLALMEHVTAAKALAGTKPVDASQEMISIGLTNMVGSFFSSIPVTGSFSRSMVNAASGAESPLGGLLTGSMIILSLQYLVPYLYFVPNSSLAAVIVCAVISNIDFKIAYQLWFSKKMDLIPWAVTFCVSLLIGLEYGILSGFLISVVFLLYYAARPRVRINSAETSHGCKFILVELDRSLVFPCVEYTRYVIMKSGNVWAKNDLPVVVDCQFIQFADFTAAKGVCDLFSVFNSKGQMLILWKAKPSIIRILSQVMDSEKTPYQFCTTEAELETLIDAKLHTSATKAGHVDLSPFRMTLPPIIESINKDKSDNVVTIDLP